MSFTENRIQQEGLTFDDVLLVPAWSEVLPREVSLKTQFTKNISLDIPIASAAMDTVTEAPMAIALAKEGGIGVLHKNMTAERQAEEVAKTQNKYIEEKVSTLKRETAYNVGIMVVFSCLGVLIFRKKNIK